MLNFSNILPHLQYHPNPPIPSLESGGDDLLESNWSERKLWLEHGVALFLATEVAIYRAYFDGSWGMLETSSCPQTLSPWSRDQKLPHCGFPPGKFCSTREEMGGKQISPHHQTTVLGVSLVVSTGMQTLIYTFWPQASYLKAMLSGGQTVMGRAMDKGQETQVLAISLWDGFAVWPWEQHFSGHQFSALKNNGWQDGSGIRRCQNHFPLSCSGIL